MARPPRPTRCGKYFHQGHVLDVCGLPPGHEGNHKGLWRSVEYSDTGGVIKYVDPLATPRRLTDEEAGITPALSETNEAE